MFFATPSTKEHTMKRFATTVATVVAVVLAALALSAVASANVAPAGVFHGGKAAPAHRSARVHADRAPAVKLARFGHHHLAV